MAGVATERFEGTGATGHGSTSGVTTTATFKRSTCGLERLGQALTHGVGVVSVCTGRA